MNTELPAFYPEKNKIGLRSVLVGISFLAFLSAPTRQARAQLSVTCTQPLHFGGFLVTRNATLRVTPESIVTLDIGISTFSKAIPGKCLIQTVASTASANVQASITVKSVTLSNGTDTMKIDNFNLFGKNSGDTVTFTASAIKAGVTMGVGSDLNINNNQGRGQYQGVITINVNRI